MKIVVPRRKLKETKEAVLTGPRVGKWIIQTFVEGERVIWSKVTVHQLPCPPHAGFGCRTLLLQQSGPQPETNVSFNLYFILNTFGFTSN